MKRLIWSCVAVACTCATVIVHVQSPAAAPAFSATALVPPPSSGWPTNGGNLSRTASFVGMERSALHRKLKSLGVVGTSRTGGRGFGEHEE